MNRANEEIDVEVLHTLNTMKSGPVAKESTVSDRMSRSTISDNKTFVMGVKKDDIEKISDLRIKKMVCLNM